MRLFFGLMILSTMLCFAERNKSLEKHIQTTPNQRIEIEGISGADIRFKSWEKDEIYFNLNVSISSSDDEYERNFITSAAINEFTTSGSIRLSFEADTKHDEGFSLFKLFRRFYEEKKISGEIYVPKKNALTTDMRYGTLSLEDIEGELNLDGVSNSLTVKRCMKVETIKNNYGKTTIEDCGGDLRLNGTSSTVSVAAFDGKVSIDADYSTVSVSQIKERISISDRSGKIKAEDISGNASLDANYSNITIKNVQGFVDVNSASATIKIYTVDGVDVDAKYSNVDIVGVSGSAGKKIIIKGQSGSLLLEDAKGDVSIDNPYSGIELKNIQGNVDLSSKSAKINATDVRGDWYSNTEYCGIKLRQLKAKSIIMTNKSESVDIRLAVIPDTMNIENEYGGVSVRIPQGFSGMVDLNSEYGSVQTNLSLNQKSHNNREYATGKIGSGKGYISIETKSADIELNEE